MKSYSQIGQDISVIKYYNNKKNGYYVDVGAYDGVQFSNTYLLEKNYNWKGICVEPSPVTFPKLKECRKNSICINKAAYSKTGEILDFSIDDMLSGITDCVDRHMIAKNGQKTKVETIRLDELLKQCNAPNFIEYLSLDTEGSELEILKSIDFDNYKFGIIHVEHNNVEPRRSQMRELLISKGYKYNRQNQFDDEYIFPQ